MEDIIISLEPALNRIERLIFWKNRYATLLAFIALHIIFYSIARAGLRPFCAVVLVCLVFHILDCLKRKRHFKKTDDNEKEKLCELTRLVLRSYRSVCHAYQSLSTLKTENKAKYSLVLFIFCLLFAGIGLKLNGFYFTYITLLILFTLPGIVYHKLVQKFFTRIKPILEQLDQSMEYKRISLIDRKDLLVKVPKKTSEYDQDDEDDEEMMKLRKQHQQKRRSLTTSDDDEEINEENLIKSNPNLINDSQTMLGFHQRYVPSEEESEDAFVPSRQYDSSFEMLTDSSSPTSTDDDNIALINKYAFDGDQIDGKHRIKIKGDELKIRGKLNKQRPKLLDAKFFQTTTTNPNYSSEDYKQQSSLVNCSTVTSAVVGGEPDLSSFDFLNDYKEE
ncbi:unnamed protein product [Didymodactylos carnosus]|uniref:RETREG1-3/ARL6IP-like N-terminal reticulon-homology domain-containing protein n=1 Tax=Didymodactylos carnosus TaxID=1234261 RepID=A0A813UQB7_9BILA|nr:unnamed protein product [Didymodactylos carnosus]CAF0833179.1 unnamed protein product [Didymodactylos carnosus]CAF3593002.1 unnamed protein product [Didymodactylos carnosus]CAF3620266.1 unnamed protein product [Didymodactylos carnosus]